MHTWMLQNPEGQRVLRERPRVTDETLEMCWNLPDGTFGKAYAQFMGVRRFSPEERPPVRFVDDPELAYVATRYREARLRPVFRIFLVDSPRHAASTYSSLSLSAGARPVARSLRLRHERPRRAGAQGANLYLTSLFFAVQNVGVSTVLLAERSHKTRLCCSLGEGDSQRGAGEDTRGLAPRRRPCAGAGGLYSAGGRWASPVGKETSPSRRWRCRSRPASGPPVETRGAGGGGRAGGHLLVRRGLLAPLGVTVCLLAPSPRAWESTVRRAPGHTV